MNSRYKLHHFVLCSVALGIFLLLSLPSAIADLTREQISELKESCALVVSQGGSGSAFCIEKGVYVTSAHVVAGTGEVSLAIQDRDGEWRTVEATRIAISKEDDVALLAIDDTSAIPIQRGTDELFETQTVTTFGFPFGRGLAAKPDSYPAISIHVGRVTALRMADSELSEIQLDAELNPGNSGGPVINEEGKVIGIVRRGIPGTALNFAKPISALDSVSATPKLEFAKNDIDPNTGGIFHVDVSFPLPPISPPELTLILDGEDEIPLTVSEGTTYSGEVPPIGAENDSNLQIEIAYADSTIQGPSPDRQISINGKPNQLKMLSHIEFGDKVVITRADGDSLSGELSGLEELEIHVGGQAIRPPLASAESITIIDPHRRTSRSYELRVSIGDEIVSTDKGVFITSTQQSQLAIGEAPSDGGADTPVQINDTREIELAGIVDDVIACDRGNVLLLKMNSLEKVAVFDNRQLKIRGYIPLSSTPAVVGANVDSAFIFYPATNLLMSYRLSDLNRIRSVESPFDGNISNIGGGCASAGPLMVLHKGKSAHNCAVSLLDPRSLERIDMDWDDETQTTDFRAGDSNHLRASADGRVFGICRTSVSPSGYNIVTLDRKMRAHYEHKSLGVIMPSWNGSLIYTRSGIFRPPFSEVVSEEVPYSSHATYIPAYHPNYYLRVVPRSERNSADDDSPPVCSIHIAGIEHRLISIDDEFEEMALGDYDNYNRAAITVDKRFHFLPSLDLLITMGGSNDRLYARSCNVRSLLQKKGVDYLFVSSVPPPATAGSRYDFQLVGESNAGKVTFQLESGPEGLKLSSSGRITWAVPDDQENSEALIMTVSDASGQQKLQTLRIGAQ